MGKSMELMGCQAFPGVLHMHWIYMLGIISEYHEILPFQAFVMFRDSLPCHAIHN